MWKTVSPHFLRTAFLYTYLSIFNPYMHTICWCPMLFLCFCSMFGVSGLPFCPVSLYFFRDFSLRPRYIVSAPIHSTLGEFQSWDCLWYPLTCGPRGVM